MQAHVILQTLLVLWLARNTLQGGPAPQGGEDAAESLTKATGLSKAFATKVDGFDDTIFWLDPFAGYWFALKSGSGQSPAGASEGERANQVPAGLSKAFATKVDGFDDTIFWLDPFAGYWFALKSGSGQSPAGASEGERANQVPAGVYERAGGKQEKLPFFQWPHFGGGP
ncbi:hypothetical protein GJAV_G00261480 [Gymnothorax javanicus]|nr:hypothetical protein GJAV_G00261480 [Gymnothorax javanicus]